MRIWQFGDEEDTLWKLVISSKYWIREGSWNSLVVRDAFRGGLLKKIRKEID